MKKSACIVLVLTVFSIPVTYADTLPAAPGMGNRSVGLSDPPNPLPHQDAEQAIRQSNSYGNARIMQDKAHSPRGGRMEGTGMQNGMNSSMGVR